MSGAVINFINHSNLEDALFRVPYFVKVLEVGSVPITQEDDGTFQFFGSGRKVYEYKTPMRKSYREISLTD